MTNFRARALSAMAALAIAAITVSAASASEYKIECISGADLVAEIYRDKDGMPYYMNEPKLREIKCRDDGRVNYLLKGYPDPFSSTKEMQSKIAEIKHVIESGMLGNLGTALYPPAIKFVYDMLQEEKAVQAKKQAANSGDPKR